MIVFGPIPSRRLGRSLGINNIPPKVCSYACVYCQLGRSIIQDGNRRSYYSSEKLFQTVKRKILKAQEYDEHIDYLTFVPDGEPTLDINLGNSIRMIKYLGYKVAVITNGSLLWRRDVRDELVQADLVSLKIDAVDPGLWKSVNHPVVYLELEKILQGIVRFSEEYTGKLLTETMLVDGLNDDPGHVQKIARYLADIQPDIAYIAVPTRPPAKKNVLPPSEDKLNRCFQIFKEKLRRVEYLIGYEGNDFAFTGNVKADLLSITAVHPMHEDAVMVLLRKAGASKDILHELVRKGQLVKTAFKSNIYYMRKLVRGAGLRNPL